MTRTMTDLLTLAIMPRDPKVPSDLALLDSMSPIEHTFAYFGSAKLDKLRADHIRSLVRSAVESAPTVRPPARSAK